MRLLSLEVDRFGALARRAFDLDGGAFVLEGPNEAGKSSFHAAVETLFYGFQPATRDAHPYASWGADRRNLRLRAVVSLADGRRLAVERRLASNPSLHVAELAADGTLAGEASADRNAPLAVLQAIPRPLFRAVYSLTANEVIEPSDEGIQELVDELLLGDRGLPGARSIRTLRKEVAKERQGLWRLDNLGQPRHRQLERELHAARKSVREAGELERGLASAEMELLELRAARERDAAELASVERDVEDAGVLAELARLDRAEAGLASAELSAFDAGSDGAPPVWEDPAALDRRIDEAARAMRGPRSRLARPPAAEEPGDRATLRCAVAIERFEAQAARDGFERAEIARHDAEASERLDRAIDLASGVAPALARAMREDAAALERAPVGALRTAAILWRDDVEAHGARLRDRSHWPVPLVVAGLAGAAAAAFGAAGRIAPELGAAGIALALLAALACALRYRPALGRLARASEPPREVLDAARGAGLTAASSLAPSALLDALGALDDARESIAAGRIAARRAAELRGSCETRSEEWARLARALGVERIDAASATALRERLRDARARAAAAEHDRLERERAGRELEEAAERHASLVAQRQSLHAALRRALPDVADPVIAYAELQRQFDEKIALRGERRQLAKHPRHAALESDPRRDPAAGAPFWSAETCERRTARRNALRKSITDALGREGELVQRLRSRPEVGAAEWKSIEQEKESELRRVRFEHDRLALLERALGEGERRFRAEHEPDVLRAASRYLERITGGRYTRVGYPDPDARSLQVRSSELDDWISVGPPLSRGVREQVHLCLRLGTLEHLDLGREPLPLVLDEALVHWDPARRAALYPVLASLTERRQVILMTCQPELAEEAERLLGARRVDLGAAPSVPSAWPTEDAGEEPLAAGEPRADVEWSR